MKNTKGKIIAVANQKGGVGKTTTTFNFGACLADAGYKVLLVDFDHQANLTLNCGISKFDSLSETIANPMVQIINGEAAGNVKVPIHQYNSNMYFVPANVTLSNVNLLLVTAMAREFILKQVLAALQTDFDYILIDCAPSLSVDLINALTAADEVLIVTNPAKFSSTGTEELIKSIIRVQTNLNSNLKISGVLFNRVDRRTNFTRDIIDIMRTAWGKGIRLYQTEIPASIRVDESQAEAQAIIEYEKDNKVAMAFMNFSKEYLKTTKGEENDC